ncbi:MAG: 50S ribosomal protein L3 [Deltaproteobacteria bacterium]|nr:50S ribosomal protein L3 [Deltaproteobacteria bacterium]
MSITILGKKIGMTQVFDEFGNRVPVTMIEAGPCPVLQVKTAEGRDGYDAVVLGFGEGREKSMTKPELGRFKKLGVKPTRFVREVRVTPAEAEKYPAGEAVDVSLFERGEKVDVIGNSRGRGFAGVMKRHGFHGARRTHGTHEYFRHGGSIGACAYPARVFKGKKMPGHYGDARITTLNLKVAAVLPDKNMILIRGSVPGPPNGLITIRKAVKTPIKKAR